MKVILKCTRNSKQILKRFHSKDAKNLIKQHTEISRDHLTPEIALHLITQNCQLWHSHPDTCPFIDPFWAFYWPGGQVLSRYILDNKELFEGKTVIDIGAGCGATSIACSLVDAHHIIANDIDNVACECIELNSELNKTSVTTSAVNLLGGNDLECDILLLGDMFYDEITTNTISDWLDHIGSCPTNILIGDPGRHSFKNHPMKNKLEKVGTYDLPASCVSENNGFTYASVWQYRPS
ncbi:hypothetical protein LOTGIDRAFT_115026 [Lottia gigantea]|uniref:ETFB lysine methyltransferase n=1 Tax=Lottia gigantea TaxID=225164 RepID=V4A0W6_LOTGI|nr:hypothetical protein LOTGIDRAFT_115026 [Lottia gigantea]ESO97448.1 hypothetical protein LOTGIDRAFT_115026 [Lottia gigantea]